MGLKKSFFIGFITALLIIFSACVFFVYAIWNLDTKHDQVILSAQKIKAIATLRAEIYNLYNFHKMDSEARNSLVVGISKDNIQNTIFDLQNLHLTSDQTQVLSGIKIKHRAFIDNEETIVNLKKEQPADFQSKITTLIQNNNQIMDSIVDLTVALVHASDTDIKKNIASDDVFKQQTIAVILVLLVCCLGLFVFTFRSAIKSYMLTIEKFKQAVEQLAQGNYNQNLNISVAEEKLCQLADSFNKMVSSVRSLHNHNTHLLNKENRDKILKSFQRCIELRDILKLYDNEPQKETSSLKLEKVIQEACELFQRVAPPNITIRNSVSRQLRPVGGSYTLWLDILLGLGINAMKAMPEGGTIQFRAINKLIEADGDIHANLRKGIYNWLMVSDSGIGISKDSLDPLFNESVSSKDSRHGMSLFEIKKKISEMGCEIVVESTENQGSDIHIFIPTLNIVDTDTRA